MAEPIDPALVRKLDAFTVPPLPDGFAARVMAAAETLPPAVAPFPELPRQRRSRSRRWLFSGGAGLGVIAAGMLSISAAAMGYFGEPLREVVDRAPVIGKVVERVIPAHLRHRDKPRTLAAKPVAHPSPAVPAIEGAEPVPPAPIRGRFASPEERRAWIEAHPEQAARIAERRRAWAGAHPARAERIAERRQQWIEAHPGQAARIAEVRRARTEANSAEVQRVAPRAAVRTEIRRRREEGALSESRMSGATSPVQPQIHEAAPRAGLAVPEADPTVPPQVHEATPNPQQPGARQLRRMERRQRLRQRRNRP
ncbi:MAG: hypothetical protein AB7F98_01050 [Novosphingobium sp.]